MRRLSEPCARSMHLPTMTVIRSCSCLRWLPPLARGTTSGRCTCRAPLFFAFESSQLCTPVLIICCMAKKTACTLAKPEASAPVLNFAITILHST